MLKLVGLVLVLFYSEGNSLFAKDSDQVASIKDGVAYTAETDFTKKAEMLESILNSGLDESEFDLFQFEVEKIIDYAKKKNKRYLLNYSKFLYSHVFLNNGEYDLTENLTSSSLSYFTENKDVRLLGFLNRDKGIIVESRREFKFALNYFKQSQFYFKECNMHMEYVHSRALEAKILIYFKEFTKAERILKGCIFHMKRYKKYKTVVGYYNFLSDLYSEQGNTKMVKYCNQMSSKFAEKSGNLNTIALSKNNLAIAKFYEDDIEDALSYFDQALETRIKMNKTKLISESYYNIATVHLSVEAYEKARIYFEKSLKIALSNNFLQESADAYLALSEVYESIGNYSEALRINKKYLLIKEKLYLDDVKQAKVLSVKINQLQSDTKYAEMSDSEEIRKKSMFFQDSVWLLLVSGYVVLLGLFLSRKKAKQVSS